VDVSGVLANIQQAASQNTQGLEDAATGVIAGAKDILQNMDIPGQFGGVQKPIVDAAAGGHPVAARPLTPEEMADAKAIFGDSLDYSKITVDGGSVASLGASRTTGNSVHLTPDLFVPGGTDTTTEGRRVLVHEMTHAWQYQHQGWSYATEALWAQAKAGAAGNRNTAYEWKSLAKTGTAWKKLNPEAQAEAVEDYNRALHKANDGTATREDYETLNLAAPYVRLMSAGPTTEGHPSDAIFNSATHMEGDVQMQDDGTWSYTWAWTYSGTKIIETPDVHEEFTLADDKGLLLDYVKEAAHGVTPGKTYLGGGSGKQKIRPGNVVWKLSVPYKDGYIGLTGGHFFAATAVQ
jgi:hypothetical protein